MSRWKSDELDNLLNVLDNAVSWGQGALASFGEKLDPKYVEQAKLELRDLDLDYRTEDEQTSTSDDDSIQILTVRKRKSSLILPQSGWKKGIVSERKKREEKERKREEIERRNRQIKKAEQEADPNTVQPIARKHYPNFLNILVDFADDKHEKTVPQTIKYFRYPTSRNIIEKKIARLDLPIHSPTDSKADCLIDQTEKVLNHINDNFFLHKGLHLSKELTNKDKIKILSKMYTDYPDDENSPSPLKVRQQDIIQTTIKYMKEHRPGWDEEQFRKRIKLDL